MADTIGLQDVLDKFAELSAHMKEMAVWDALNVIIVKTFTSITKYEAIALGMGYEQDPDEPDKWYRKD